MFAENHNFAFRKFVFKGHITVVQMKTEKDTSFSKSQVHSS